MYDAFGSKSRFEDIVDRLYVISVENYRTERRAAVERLGLAYDRPWLAEPFAFNPLVKRPLVKGIAGAATLAPAPEEIARRASSEGVVYEGLERYGPAFTTDVGHFFEGYIGRQLQLLRGARVHGEVVLTERAGKRSTVDWIVELEDAILLVECKSALPRRDVVGGWETFSDGHAQVMKGREQILESFEEIRRGRPELGFLSDDRPVVGLVVTLGSFYAGNDSSVVGVPASKGVQTGVVDAEFLEGLVTMPPEDVRTFVRRMSEKEPTGHIEPRDLCEGLQVQRNMLLEEAFDSLPLLDQLDPSARS